MRKHPLHRIALMQCPSCLVPFGLTPFGPRSPPEGHTCPDRRCWVGTMRPARATPAPHPPPPPPTTPHAQRGGHGGGGGGGGGGPLGRARTGEGSWSVDAGIVHR